MPLLLTHSSRESVYWFLSNTVSATCDAMAPSLKVNTIVHGLMPLISSHPAGILIGYRADARKESPAPVGGAGRGLLPHQRHRA